MGCIISRRNNSSGAAYYDGTYGSGLLVLLLLASTTSGPKNWPISIFLFFSHSWQCSGPCASRHAIWQLVQFFQMLGEYRK